MTKPNQYEIEAFLRDLINAPGALNPERLRLTLARNDLKLVKVRPDEEGSASLPEELIHRGRIDGGPLEDVVRLDDVEEWPGDE